MMHRFVQQFVPSVPTVMTISNSPHPCSVTSYGGCESSLVGFWKLECSWNTTFIMDHTNYRPVHFKLVLLPEYGTSGNAHLAEDVREILIVKAS